VTHQTQPEVCLCAAILYSDGYIVRGHRHHDCLRTAWDDLKRRERGTQGFLTSRGRFVNRDEGLQLQFAAGIESAAPSGYRAELYSEDLY
jgi:hypothetical protein